MSERGGGHERLAFELGSHPIELAASGSCAVEVARRNRDLHLCLEQRRTPKIRVRGQLFRRHLRGPLERVAYGSRRQDDVPMGQMNQCKARLRIPPGVVSREQGLLCASDISFPQSYPSELGERPSELASQV